MASDTKSKYENKQYLILIEGLWMTIGDTYGARLLPSLFFSFLACMDEELQQNVNVTVSTSLGPCSGTALAAAA
jgi:hypothetical protein